MWRLSFPSRQSASVFRKDSFNCIMPFRFRSLRSRLRTFSTLPLTTKTLRQCATPRCMWVEEAMISRFSCSRSVSRESMPLVSWLYTIRRAPVIETLFIWACCCSVMKSLIVACRAFDRSLKPDPLDTRSKLSSSLGGNERLTLAIVSLSSKLDSPVLGFHGVLIRLEQRHAGEAMLSRGVGHSFLPLPLASITEINVFNNLFPTYRLCF